MCHGLRRLFSDDAVATPLAESEVFFPKPSDEEFCQLSSRVASAVSMFSGTELVLDVDNYDLETVHRVVDMEHRPGVVHVRSRRRLNSQTRKYERVIVVRSAH